MIPEEELRDMIEDELPEAYIEKQNKKRQEKVDEYLERLKTKKNRLKNPVHQGEELRVVLVGKVSFYICFPIDINVSAS